LRALARHKDDRLRQKMQTHSSGERSASARTIPACRKVEKRRPRRAERRTAPPLCLYPKAQLGTRGNAGPSSNRRLLIIWITGLGKSRKAHPHATVKAS